MYNTDYAPDSALTDTEKSFNTEVDVAYAKLNECGELLTNSHINDSIRRDTNKIIDQYKSELATIKASVAQIDENLQKSYIAQFKNQFDRIKKQTNDWLRYFGNLKLVSTQNSSESLLKAAEMFYLLVSS